jgi:hypothetical protein
MLSFKTLNQKIFDENLNLTKQLLIFDQELF